MAHLTNRSTNCAIVILVTLRPHDYLEEETRCLKWAIMLGMIGLEVNNKSK